MCKTRTTAPLRHPLRAVVRCLDVKRSSTRSLPARPSQNDPCFDASTTATNAYGRPRPRHEKACAYMGVGYRHGEAARTSALCLGAAVGIPNTTAARSTAYAVTRARAALTARSQAARSVNVGLLHECLDSALDLCAPHQRAVAIHAPAEAPRHLKRKPPSPACQARGHGTGGMRQIPGRARRRRG